MAKKGLLLVRFTAAIGLAALGACTDQAPSSVPMPLGAPTLAPRGFLQFCVRRPDQCGLEAPLTEIKAPLLAAALNREQWGHVLSIGRGAGEPVATEDKPKPDETDQAVQTPILQDRPAASPAIAAGDEQPRTAEPLIQPEFMIDPAERAESVTPHSPAATAPTASSTAAPLLEELFKVVQRDTPTVLSYNPSLWSHLTAVNLDVNARIRPRTDQEAFGVDDYWTLPLDVGGRNEGNCKHYALEKRRLLIEGGMSPNALSLAVVRTLQNEVHAVLIVSTDRGDFVLDNLTPEIRGWRETGYVWLSRQTPGQPLRWAALGDAPASGG